MGGADTGSGWHPFLYDHGTVTDLGTLGGHFGYDGFAEAINKQGQIVGWSNTGAVDANQNPIHHAFLYENGVMTDLASALPGNSQARGINDLGQVVGEIEEVGAFLYANNVLRIIGTGIAYDINNSGQIAFWPDAIAITSRGDTVSPSDPRERAILITGGQRIYLDTLLPADSGWTLERAYDINDKGQIVGRGHRNGEQHAFLLDAASIIPEPPAYLTLLVGFGVLGMRRWQTCWLRRVGSRST